MSRLMRSAGVVAGITVLASVALAHHSQIGIFDSSKTMELTGVIKTISWRNPHGQILLTVSNADGSETVWDAETASIAVMRNRTPTGATMESWVAYHVRMATRLDTVIET